MGEENCGAARTRTFSWEDPKALAEAARGLTGLEFLRKVVSGELPGPPIAALMNFGLAELGEGSAVFTVEPAEYHYNPIGVVHGGRAATAEGRVVDGGGRLYAHATTTCLIFRP